MKNFKKVSTTEHTRNHCKYYGVYIYILSASAVMTMPQMCQAASDMKSLSSIVVLVVYKYYYY